MMTMMAMTVKVMMMWSSLTAGLMAERVRDQLHQEEEEEDLATPWLEKIFIKLFTDVMKSHDLMQQLKSNIVKKESTINIPNIA